MIDSEINRAVAQVMGWTQTDGRWIDVNGDGYDDYGNPPDYCNDLAVLGTLLVWLAGKGYGCGVQTALVGAGDDNQYTAGVWGGGASHKVTDTQPGRALALAALRAYGVEVTG